MVVGLKGALAMKVQTGAVRRAFAAMHTAIITHRLGHPESPTADVLLEQHKDTLPPRLNVG
jgi:hypothetical protein